MLYLECRYSKYGFGTYIKGQILFGNYDFFICNEDFNIEWCEKSKIILKEDFIKNILPKLTSQDIVHVTCNTMDNLKGLEKSRCKKILTIHDTIPLNVRSGVFKFVKWKKQVQFAIKQASIIITVSESSKNDIIKYFSADSKKIYVLYSYPQIGIERKSEREIKSFREENCITDNEYMLCCVGSMAKHKNFIRMILAWKKSQVYSCSKMIVTTKRNTRKFSLLLKMLGVYDKVIIPGYVSLNEVSLIYSSSDIFMFCSLSEGFGVPPLEAMLCKTPVLASKIPCICEVLGDAAFLVNPTEIDDITYGLETVLLKSNERQRLVENGSNRVNLYSKEVFKTSLSEILDKINSIK